MRSVWWWRGFLWGLFGWAIILFSGGIIPFVFAILEGNWRVFWIAVGVAVGVSVVYLIWLTWYAGAFYRSYRFQVRTEDVQVTKGVVFRSTRRVPLRRVQDVVVKDGPLLRGASLGSVHLQTAAQGATSKAEAILPGLSDADDVATRLLERVQASRQ